MSILQKLAVEHPYYCSDSNYYSNEASQRFETMTEFLDEWEGADLDMNLIFRWDIKPRGDTGAETGRYCAKVFIMLQRKGIFMPVYIAHINEAEAERFETLAQQHWTTIQALWNPISGELLDRVEGAGNDQRPR